MPAQNTGSPDGSVTGVVLGATRNEGGTRSRTYTIGGDTGMPFVGNRAEDGNPRLVALEICDDSSFWSPIVCDYVGDLAGSPGEWAKAAEERFGADLVRFYFTSTKQRDFQDFGSITSGMEELLQVTTRPLIIEGSNEAAIDSEVFRRCGEAGEGERLLLGTAEADRYRSVAAAALAYGHAVIAQTPIDINLAKQLNILLRETGVDPDRIVIDPYTGALGYGFEYSYSVMERIRTVALKGDTDLAKPMISSAIDSLNVREVREMDPELLDEMAVSWEYYAGLSAFVAGANIVCVRHPRTVERLKETLHALESEGGDSP
jgi:acetyl-CoA decarbonylase/synthase complex subunit delta